MRKIALLLALGGSCLAAPAMAQDESTFTGPRVEGIIGYDISRAGSSSPATGQDKSIDGLLYGVGVGFDIAAGSLVVGAEGEFTDSTAKTSYDNAPAGIFGLGQVSTGRDLYAGVRLGVRATPSTLVYAKGGYTNARYNVLANNGTTQLDQRIDTDGWRLGAGAEVAMSENTFAKVEYRYSNYTRGEIDFPASTPDSQRFTLDTDRHQVVAAVGLRF